jgi:hypothetical protein
MSLFGTALLTVAIVLIGCGVACTPLPHLDDGENDDTVGGSGSPPPSQTPPHDVPPPDGPTSDLLSVGPAGGHLVFKNGVVLDVPPGALAEVVSIGATILKSVPAGTDLPAAQFITGVHLEPHGLVFAIPATLTMPLPNGPTELRALSLNEAFEAADELDPNDEEGPDPLLPEPLRILATTGANIRLEIVHFSDDVIVDPKCPAITVGKLTNCSTATLCTEGISSQIMQVWQKQGPPILSSMPTSAATPDDAYLASDALSDLLNAAKEAPIKANYAWRSLATQVVTSQACSKNGGIAAKIGKSAHGAGAALDLGSANFRAAQTKCCDYLKAHPSAPVGDVMEAVVPKTGKALLNNNWVWWGFFKTGRDVKTSCQTNTKNELVIDRQHI